MKMKCGLQNADCGMEVRNGFLPAFFGGIERHQEKIATYGRFLWIVRFPFRNPHFIFHSSPS
jgi:hypothetical protein